MKETKRNDTNQPEPCRGRKRHVQRIEANLEDQKKLRVACYCRVSTDFEEQETSIEAQRSHYAAYICSNPDWVLADVYWEKGVSATKAATRPELMRLLSDCSRGLIDLVITKSISRFSRNTSDCLEMVRTLGAIGVRIIFEKEGIDTGRMESELLLTLLSAFAENESRSLSLNMKWGIRKRFEAGTYKVAKVPYGYRRGEDGPGGKPVYVMDPAESETVRRIFHSFLSGKGGGRIARELNAEGIPTWTAQAMGTREDKGKEGKQGTGTEGKEGKEKGKGWTATSIRNILGNPFYTGDCVYQKTYRDEAYRQRKNRGELDMFIREDDHEAIVSREVFEGAKALLKRHAQEGGKETPFPPEENKGGEEERP